MRKMFFYIVILLLLQGCITESPSKRLNFYVANNFDNSITINYWGSKNSNAVLLSTFEIEKNEKKFVERTDGIVEADIFYFAFIRSSDSVQVIFSDGKIKTDRFREKDTDAPSMYNEAFYTTSPCGKNCVEFIYNINEQDYAEAK